MGCGNNKPVYDLTQSRKFLGKLLTSVEDNAQFFNFSEEVIIHCKKFEDLENLDEDSLINFLEKSDSIDKSLHFILIHVCLKYMNDIKEIVDDANVFFVLINTLLAFYSTSEKYSANHKKFRIIDLIVYDSEEKTKMKDLDEITKKTLLLVKFCINLCFDYVVLMNLFPNGKQDLDFFFHKGELNEVKLDNMSEYVTEQVVNLNKGFVMDDALDTAGEFMRPLIEECKIISIFNIY